MNLKKGSGLAEGRGREAKSVLALNGRKLLFCSTQAAHHQAKDKKVQLKDYAMWCSESIIWRAVCGPFRGLALELIHADEWRM